MSADSAQRAVREKNLYTYGQWCLRVFEVLVLGP